MSRLCIPGRTYYFWFYTGSPGGPGVTLSGSPVISCYSGAGGLTQFTTGVTLSADYDGLTGLNRIAVDMTDATAYPFNEDFALIITTGTVSGVSAIGVVVAEFNSRAAANGIIQAGILVDAGTDTTNFVLPTGRRAGVAVGNVIAPDGLGQRFIATYNSGTGAGTVTTAFSGDASTVFAQVFAVPPAETAATGLLPVDVQAVNGVAITGDGDGTPFGV